MSKAYTLFPSPFSLPNSFRCFHFVLFLSLCFIHCFPSLLSFAFPQSIFPFRSFHPKYLKLKKTHFLPLGTEQKNLLILVQLGKTDTLVCKNACLHWGLGTWYCRLEIYVRVTRSLYVNEVKRSEGTFKR